MPAFSKSKGTGRRGRPSRRGRGAQSRVINKEIPMNYVKRFEVEYSDSASSITSDARDPSEDQMKNIMPSAMARRPSSLVAPKRPAPIGKSYYTSPIPHKKPHGNSKVEKVRFCL